MGRGFGAASCRALRNCPHLTYLNNKLRSHRYSVCGVGVEVDAGDARRWAEHFAAASYGDSLLGAALTLLLRPEAQPAVQARSCCSGAAVLAAATLERNLRILNLALMALCSWQPLAGSKQVIHPSSLLKALASCAAAPCSTCPQLSGVSTNVASQCALPTDLHFRINEKQHATAGRDAGIKARLDCKI